MKKQQIDYERVDWEAPLADVLKQLIALRNGIEPTDVTIQYVRKQREKNVYPKTRFEAGSKYGGYGTHRLRFRSRREQERVSRDAEKFLENF